MRRRTLLPQLLLCLGAAAVGIGGAAYSQLTLRRAHATLQEVQVTLEQLAEARARLEEVGRDASRATERLRRVCRPERDI